MTLQDVPVSEWDKAFPPPNGAQLEASAPCRFCGHAKAEHDASMPGTDNWKICYGDECRLRGYYHAFHEAK
jgi:hypothetical protein